ncbi:MAG: Flp family type IVb pilin [Pseudomonadota bacterium]
MEIKKIMLKNFVKFLQNENGATAVEYSIIAALISIAAVAAIKQVGVNANAQFQNVAGNLSSR